jgi:hypothetical protein
MIAIQSKSCLRGTATQFDVYRVVYSFDGSAAADCLLKDADGMLVDSLVSTATAEQTALWTDDAAFFAVLATNAGLTPA